MKFRKQVIRLSNDNGKPSGDTPIETFASCDTSIKYISGSNANTSVTFDTYIFQNPIPIEIEQIYYMNVSTGEFTHIPSGTYTFSTGNSNVGNAYRCKVVITSNLTTHKRYLTINQIRPTAKFGIYGGGPVLVKLADNQKFYMYQQQGENYLMIKIAEGFTTSSCTSKSSKLTTKTNMNYQFSKGLWTDGKIEIVDSVPYLVVQRKLNENLY